MLNLLLGLGLSSPGRADEPIPAVAPSHPVAAAVEAAPEPSPKGHTRAPVARSREILLTFDDGPRLDTTPQVLDLLDAHGLKAVFFVNGWRFQGKSEGANKARALLREMLRRGHVVGNHTVHHFFLCGKKGPKIAAQEIEENATLIEEAIGMRPPLFRTPYGAHCKTLTATLEGLGIKPIGWDIDPQDWRLRDTEKVLAYMQQALSRHKGRAIVLFHDVQPATVAALPRLLDWIDEQNAADRAAGRQELKIIDYRFLLPDHPVVPPVIDALGRLLVETLSTWPAPLSLLPPLPLLPPFGGAHA